MISVKYRVTEPIRLQRRVFALPITAKEWIAESMLEITISDQAEIQLLVDLPRQQDIH